MKTQIQSRIPDNQSHLLSFWDELDSEQQSRLAAQIEQVDFDLIARLHSSDEKAEDWSALASRAETPSAIRLSGSGNKYSADEARAAGEKALREGKVGVIVVAGGQGSRLGFPHPKGMYKIGPISDRTLFEIHADRIIASSQRYGATIPLYLMTSPATHEETVEYFAANSNCGLKDLQIFCQGTMPAVDAATGKLLMAEKDQLFLSPDGHGGTLAALENSGSLADMKSKGIEWLFYFQVDNPLVEIADPEFIGYHILSGSEMTSQVIAKTDPAEKVGVVVSVDDVTRIIEYSDLPDEHAARTLDDGSLALWAGSIAVHVFDVAFLDAAKGQAAALPFHNASKKVPYIDNEGNRVDPSEPNATKFERFIFDLLPSAKNGLVVEVAESEGFAPLKNAPGAPKDTEESVKAAMVALHRGWAKAAGLKIADAAMIEINPRYAMDAGELKLKLAGTESVDSGTYFK